MVFSSAIFLFLFLPVTLAGYFLLPRRLRNLWLLGASLVFYAWGEPRFVVVMLGSIAFNFLLALWIARADATGARRRLLAVAVAGNLGLLAVFKYADFLTANVNAALAAAGAQPLPLPGIALPIGISFFTFQALSYVIDVYRREVAVQRNPLDLGLYIALFPQLIAGPIVRYHDVAAQIAERSVTRAGFAYGVQRFVIGLGKKVLIANTLAVQADLVFSIPPDQLTASVAWFGLVCYTLQIYFDFSGYSDMAIGLGHMLGFRFLENFSHPYVAQSVTEFWRRWHISLSTWFRDYLYVPLGGNRVSAPRVYRNLFIVFLLCGLWHGASWTFVAWGMMHGLALVLERMGLARLLQRWPAALRHAYVLLFVMLAWVFFRADTFGDAAGFLRAMAGASPATGLEHSLAMLVDVPTLLALLAGIVGSAPVLSALRSNVDRLRPGMAQATAGVLGVAALSAILFACSLLIAAGTYNPFIYFRF
ncbi:MAG: alginate regulatory protein [Betaproteobacteria bacterium]|nr:MAG: alginate regulatory protein [Betaproteobacteria bacterium]